MRNCSAISSTAIGIAHDENGTIEELPPEPTKEALIKAIDPLFEKHDPAVVAVYLHASPGAGRATAGVVWRSCSPKIPGFN